MEKQDAGQVVLQQVQVVFASKRAARRTDIQKLATQALGCRGCAAARDVPPPTAPPSSALVCAREPPAQVLARGQDLDLAVRAEQVLAAEDLLPAVGCERAVRRQARQEDVVGRLAEVGDRVCGEGRTASSASVKARLEHPGRAGWDVQRRGEASVGKGTRCRVDRNLPPVQASCRVRQPSARSSGGQVNRRDEPSRRRC